MRWRTSLAVAALTCQIGEDLQHVGRFDLGVGPTADLWALASATSVAGASRG